MCLLKENELEELTKREKWLRLINPNETTKKDSRNNRVCPKCEKAPKLYDSNWEVLYCRHSFWDDFADVVAKAFPEKEFWVLADETLGGGEVTDSCEGRLVLYAGRAEVENIIKDLVKDLNDESPEEFDEESFYPERLEDASISTDINLSIGEKHLILFIKARGKVYRSDKGGQPGEGTVTFAINLETGKISSKTDQGKMAAETFVEALKQVHEEKEDKKDGKKAVKSEKS